MNKLDLALNNLQWLIYHKTKPIFVKSCLYIYIKIYDLSTHFVDDIFKQTLVLFFFTQLNGFKYCYIVVTI